MRRYGLRQCLIARENRTPCVQVLSVGLLEVRMCSSTGISYSVTISLEVVGLSS